MAEARLDGFQGRYEIIRSLGVGSMGEVWLARQRSLDRLVALKVFRIEQQAELGGTERFLREARYLEELRHPNLLRLFEVGFAHERPYLAMEYVEGEDLARRLEGEGRLELGEAVQLSCRILEALVVIHEAGLIHRDLKPANVLLGKDGTVKVADFGLARPLGGEEALTASGIVLGTPSYMPPEQAYGREPTAAWDLYALATMLYEMLSGMLPFPGEDGDAVIEGKLAGAAPALRSVAPHVEPALAEVVDRAIHPHMDRRYPDATQLMRAIVRGRDGEAALPDTAAFAPLPKGQGRRVFLFLLPLALGVLLALALAFGGSSPAPGPTVETPVPKVSTPSLAPAERVDRIVRAVGAQSPRVMARRIRTDLDHGDLPQAARRLRSFRETELWRDVQALAPQLSPFWKNAKPGPSKRFCEALLEIESLDRVFTLRHRPAPLGIRDLLDELLVVRQGNWGEGEGRSLLSQEGREAVLDEHASLEGHCFFEADELGRAGAVELLLLARGLGPWERLDLSFDDGAFVAFMDDGVPRSGELSSLVARCPTRGFQVGVNRCRGRFRSTLDEGRERTLTVLDLRIRLVPPLTVGGAAR